MNRLLILFCTVLASGILGCKKKDDLNTSTFSVYVADFYPGTSTTVTIFSRLKDGMYVIRYGLTGKGDDTIGSIKYSTAFSGLRATVNIKDGKCSFTTPVLTYPECVTITIDSVFNASNTGVATFVTREFCDSTGNMTANIDGVQFKSHRVQSLVQGTKLHILGETGTLGATDWSRIDVVVSPYNRKLSGLAMSGAVFTGLPDGSNYFPLGRVPPRYLTVGDLVYATNGNVSFSTTSPSMTGTFSLILSANSKISNGVFTVAAP